jgi:hypothetical protein
VSLDGRRRHLSHAQEDSLALGDLTKDVGTKLADDLAAGPLGFHDAGSSESTDVPRNQRLAEPDGIDQFAYGCRALRKPSDDAKAVNVRERLVENAQLAKIVGLIDDCGDGAPEVRW